MGGAELPRTAAAGYSPKVLASRGEALEAVRALAPRFRLRARQVDSDRTVPEQTVREMLDAGLFGIVTPRSLGGSELGFAALVEATAEIASACGSTGWVYGVLAGHSWILNLFPLQAQLDVFADARHLTATVFRFAAEVRAVPGGYRLTRGEGRFCSGIDHAHWVVIGAAVQGEVPEQRFFVIPRSDISEVVDDWFVAGMRGTGSKTIRVSEAFIPEHRSVSAEALMSGAAPGARHHQGGSYRIPMRYVAPFSLVGVPIGVARAAIQSFSASLGRSLESYSSEQVAEQSATFARLGVAAAEVDAARATVIENAARLDQAAGAEELAGEAGARIVRDWAFAAQRARAAVTSLFESAGGSATYDHSELQRLWRDVNAAAQHIAFSWDSAMTNYGRALAGVEPAKFGPKGRS